MNLVLRLAWRNLWRQPRRTWLTTGAMVFSNVLLVFMISLQFGMYRLMIENSLETFTGHLQVQAQGYIDEQKIRQTIPDVGALAQDLRQELGSDDVAARATAFALASSEDRSYGIAVFGVEPRYEPNVSNIPGLVRDGRYLQDSGEAELVIGSVLARNLKVGVGDELTLIGSGRDGSFAAVVAVIVGIFDSGVAELDRTIAEMPLAPFQDVFYMQGAGHQVVVNAPRLGDVADLRQRVASLIPQDRGLVVHDWDALVPGLKQAIQADISSAVFMYAVLVILVAFSVLNTQLMSVLERTHEFGIVLALGLKPGRLGRLVMLETALMGGMGLLIGALVGGALTAWLGVHGFTLPGMEEMGAKFNLPSRLHPQVTLASLVSGPAVVFLFSLLASVYPALRLRRLQPVEAMRAA
ncbi:MAG TPA: FtsX-like permease family protein [Woeseiaceae bacterium]|nr:FtsX-like permease family protein [Woeseiaceae bacterium]